MSSNDPITSPETLSLPHFNEEETLLSARPVVPLHEVRAETRSKRRWIFALTIVAAIMVGGIGASLFLMQDDNPTNVTQGSANSSSDLSQPNESGSLSDPKGESPGAQSMNPGEAVSVSKEQVDQRPSSASPSLKPNVNKVQVTPTSSTVRPTRINPPASRPAEPASVRPDDAANVEMDDRRLRREERREARRLRRERRNSREQSGDDLMRIREIFEGTPRP